VDELNDFLATIFVGAMSVLIVIGLFLYEDRQTSGTVNTSSREPAAKVVAVAAKP